MSERLSVIPAQAVFDQRLGNADLRVFSALGAFADRSGKCWPATTTLARKLGVSDRRVRACLRILEASGYLHTEHRPGQRSVYMIVRKPLDPGTSASGVDGNPGTSPSGGAERELPGTPEGEVPPKDSKKDPLKEAYAFDGKIIRLNQHDYDTWAKAYPLIDLRAQIQALDDYYDRNLTGKDRTKCFWRCSQALAKKNERARAGRGQEREEPKFNDGVY